MILPYCFFFISCPIFLYPGFLSILCKYQFIISFSLKVLNPGVYSSVIVYCFVIDDV